MDDFKKALDSHNQQLARIIDGLDKEIKSREKGDEDIGRKLDRIDSIWSTFRAGFNIVWMIIAGLVGASIAVIVQHFWK